MTDINLEWTKISDGGTGIEEETVESDEIITEPFDPSSIRVSTKYFTIGQLIERMEEKSLDLSPDFQRQFVWKEGAQSRLIESMFIRFPLPAFYMDATNDEKWLVVDGLQRLSTIREFVVKKTLTLSELEFLGKEYNGKKYDDLPAVLKRRIKETQVIVYLIEKGTPPEVKFDIFKRINTGGLPLSAQEIRHAINQGPVTSFLTKLAHSEEFEMATDYSIRDTRMEAREMALRFLAFALTSYTAYTRPDLDRFLNDKMAEFNQIFKREPKQQVVWETRFKRAMKAAYDIFGTDTFRKRYAPNARRSFVNKALFETWAVNLDKCSDSQLKMLVKRSNQVQNTFIKLMNTKDFNNAISQGTGSVSTVKFRFRAIEQLIQEVLA